MKKIIIAIWMSVFVLACTDKPQDVALMDEMPRIFPDYVDVTVPVGIAPLNFNVLDEKGKEVDAVDVVMKGSVGGEMHVNGAYACWNEKDWHELLEKNRGGKLKVVVCAKEQGQWKQYKEFEIHVSNDALEAYGLTYRRIRPGYEVYSKMGIYQRNLSNFEEEAIIENSVVTGMCINCHTVNRTNPDQTTFHVRGMHGATMVKSDGKREWLKAQIDSIKGAMVYPYWHPTGRYCAYSTNKTSQSFHAVKEERIEVFDQSSDVFVYHPESKAILLDSLLMTKSHYETYPVFSYDGKSLYFCSSIAEPIPERYREIRYNICRIDFDAEKGEFGNEVDTVFNACVMGKSATHPRPSYDGRYLMFTMADYGCFPIWHKEADNWLLDLRTGEAKPMDVANSADTDSWHNWDSGSKWFVFTSRRGDGLHTRLYLASVSDDGKVTKPFLLPQQNPLKYDGELFDSYNTPDFISKSVEMDYRSVGREIYSDERIKVGVK